MRTDRCRQDLAQYPCQLSPFIDQGNAEAKKKCENMEIAVRLHLYGIV